MRFRFTLSHPDSGVSLEISEPDGWKNAVLKLDRDENFHSLIEYFDGSFIFYGDNGQVNGGIDFIKAIERVYGVDATVEILIEITLDEQSFETVFDGQLKLSDAEEMPDNKIRVPIIRDDFWAKFIARFQTPVDLQATRDLDGDLVTPTNHTRIHLPSQVIQKLYRGELDQDFNIPQSDWNTGEFLQFDMTIDERDEIDEKYNIPTAPNPIKPVNLFLMEEAGLYSWDIRLEARIIDAIGETFSTSDYLTIYFQIGEDAPIAFTETDYTVPFGSGTISSTVYEFNQSMNILAGSQVRIYGEMIDEINDVGAGSTLFNFVPSTDSITASGAGDSQGDLRATHLYVLGETVTPATVESGFLVHDAALAIIKSYGLGSNNPFYSDLLGSSLTSRSYENNGCGWSYLLIRGLQLRGYDIDEKPFFSSMELWWRGLDPILNLSLMYDHIDGEQVIRVEEKSFQYDYSGGTSIDFSNVRSITRKYDNDRLVNRVEIGYARWQSEDISGIDDPQTKKTYATRFKKVGKGTSILSEFIGASLAIEQTRRTTKEKSSDYKFDNEIFIIAINPQEVIESPEESPDLIHFNPELDENFTSITNLLNPDTRYNIKITPARNFLRWQNFIQGGLQSYIGSEFQFTSGEGNYDMESAMVENGCLNEDYNGVLLGENDNITVDNNFIHLADLYEIEIPVQWDEYKTIRDNRRKPIGISQSDSGHVPMFIKTMEYQPVKGEAKILAWAKEYLDLGVVEDTTPTQECYLAPNFDPCEDALTDELGEILTDELGVCLTD